MHSELSVCFVAFVCVQVVAATHRIAASSRMKVNAQEAMARIASMCGLGTRLPEILLRDRVSLTNISDLHARLTDSEICFRLGMFASIRIQVTIAHTVSQARNCRHCKRAQ